MACRCAKHIAEHTAYSQPVVIHHAGSNQRSEVEKVCDKFRMQRLAVGDFNDADVVATLNAIKPDIVFSVNNWDVIRAELLTIPGDGIINFHNGPLPDYRGVNVPSWAIINGEKCHGVSWHFVSAKIDAGDIVASKAFELSREETAISLTLRCIQAGLELFPPLLDQYAAGNLESCPQEEEGRYFSARALPPNDGYLDFNWTFEKLSALVRGLTFRPFDNLFTYPKIRLGSTTLLVSEITLCGGRSESADKSCGEIRIIDAEGITVCARDGLIKLRGLMQEDLNQPSISELASRYDLTVGKVLK